MSKLIVMIVLLSWPALAQQGSKIVTKRAQAEYYVAAYARHYRVPIRLVRAIIERESNWRECVVSQKGAVGLMQLMPRTAQRLQVQDRCNIEQNISGGVRYLAWLCQLFRRDYRLVAAAYYAGEEIVNRRGLGYHNPDVIKYVQGIRKAYLQQPSAGTNSQTEVPQ